MPNDRIVGIDFYTECEQFPQYWNKFQVNSAFKTRKFWKWRIPNYC